MTKNIFLVEDNDDLRELIEFMLNSESYSIYSCSTAKYFFEKLKDQKPDLIILDIMLPDGNGEEICKQLKSEKETQDIPVLLMSANLNYKNMPPLAEAFIAKPFDMKEFLNTIDDLMVRTN